MDISKDIYKEVNKNLETTYLGLNLVSPIIMSSSPLTLDIDNFKKLEDQKIGAITMHTIYEEQVKLEEEAVDYYFKFGSESYQEAVTYFPKPSDATSSLDEYLNLIRKAKESVKTPIIASINAFTLNGWKEYAKQCETAGADAIELNIYYLTTNIDVPGYIIEQEYVEILKEIKRTVKIPVGVKLSPYFTNFGNIAKNLDDCKVDGLVLFNRFYQPHLDIRSLKIERTLVTSMPNQVHQQTLWIGILYNKIEADLAATGGIHTAPDIVKVLMSGAKSAMICSVILEKGISYISELHTDLSHWLDLNEYANITALIGVLSHKSNVKSEVFFEAHYMPHLKDASKYRGSIFPRSEHII